MFTWVTKEPWNTPLTFLVLRLAIIKLFQRMERRTDMTRLIFVLFNCFKKVETSKRNMVKCKVKQITVLYVHLSCYILNSFLKWDCRTYRNANTQFMHSHVAKLTSRCYRRSDRHVGKQDAVNFQFILGGKKSKRDSTAEQVRQSVLSSNGNKTRLSLKEFEEN